MFIHNEPCLWANRFTEYNHSLPAYNTSSVKNNYLCFTYIKHQRKYTYTYYQLLELALSFLYAWDKNIGFNIQKKIKCLFVISVLFCSPYTYKIFVALHNDNNRVQFIFIDPFCLFPYSVWVMWCTLQKLILPKIKNEMKKFS
jgi:hypothetical protein